MSLSDEQIAGAVRDAGFPPKTWTVAVAVALAESGGNPTATNNNSNGSTDYGLFQINSVHASLLNSHAWSDPTDNARMALVISSHGSNWSPWVAYTTGRYRVYLPRARRATGKPATPSGGGMGDSSGAVTTAGFPNLLSGDFWSMLTDPDTWQRVGFILAGSFLLLLGLSRMTTIDNTLRKVGLKAAEIAAVA